MSDKTFKIQIKGRVQGVGFRPFVFNLAQRYKINGSVSNNSEGVIIKATTTQKKVTVFLEMLLKNPPTVSIISTYALEEVETEIFTTFSIVPSAKSQNINIPLTPDFTICNECKNEIKDIENRRFAYPFTTCTHCGPRYAITTQFPFERENTSLSGFEMCRACETEYKDHRNRRFHSQTNSCTDCGIHLELVDANGKGVAIDKQKILQKTAEIIAEGKIVALKNTNGYLLCCDATNSETITQLRQKKKRPNKPFAVLYPTIEKVEKDFQLDVQEKEALTSTVGPIVILKNTKKTSIVTEIIAPFLNQTGVLLPPSSLLELLMNILKKPIVCTSGNIHGSPIISENKLAQEKLNTVAHYFLHHNLDIQFPQDDSVIKIVNDQKVILRRSRGYAPNYISDTNKNTPSILAMGAHLKSTFSLIPNAHIYVSQYFGNLDSYDVSKRYLKTIKQQLNVFNFSPKTLLIDAHPAYQSSIIGKELAKEYNSQLRKIQHHKAHFASVLGEHQLFDTKEKILGIIWDGTGYGDDHAIWGGEFFTYENHKIERINHFKYYDWIANDKMAKEPRIALLSLLGNDDRDLIQSKFSKTEWKVYKKMLQNKALKTSSVGRLFDAVASALNIKDINTFESEASILLEDSVASSKNHNFIDLLEGKEYTKIPSKLLIKTVFKSYQAGAPKAYIAGSFIYTLGKIIIKIAEKNNIKTIACSGGVFQNSVLIKILSYLCENHKINLKINRRVSANDENISFGQLMYYQNIKN